MQSGLRRPTDRCFANTDRCFANTDRSETRMHAVSFLFILAVDCVLKTSTFQMGNGIQWTPWVKLDDLNFADDLALLSCTQRQMKKETSMAVDNSACLGLKVHSGEKRSSRTICTTAITLVGGAPEECGVFFST